MLHFLSWKAELTSKFSNPGFCGRLGKPLPMPALQKTANTDTGYLTSRAE
jgi:hypothetical protein